MTKKTTQFFSLGGGGELLGKYRAILSNGYAYKSIKRHILFVCGGDISKENFRKGFLEYANDNLGAYHIFLAEEAFKSLSTFDDDVAHNLALFEATICEVSDCILIFPESVGSYCEVGFFSNIENIRKKTLIVNNYDHHARSSFINEGPIALIGKETLFSAPIILNSQKPDYFLIKDRLNKKLKVSSKRKTFDCEDYVGLNLQEKLFLINEIINIFGPCTLLSIEEILRGLFGTYKRIEVQQILSILLGANFIKYSEDHPEFCYSLGGKEDFIEYRGEAGKDLRADVLEHYQSHGLKPYEVLEDLEGDL